MANTFVDNTKVMAKGQVTIPKDIREVLGVASGDRITFIVDDRPILRAAIETKTDVLLTGDKDFLESGVKNPNIMTPTDYTIASFRSVSVKSHCNRRFPPI